VNLKTNQTIKTYDDFIINAFSKDNKFIFGINMYEQNFVRIILENDEEDIIDQNAIEHI